MQRCIDEPGQNLPCGRWPGPVSAGRTDRLAGCEDGTDPGARPGDRDSSDVVLVADGRRLARIFHTFLEPGVPPEASSCDFGDHAPRVWLRAWSPKSWSYSYSYSCSYSCSLSW